MNRTEYCEASKAELAVSLQDLACRDGLGEIDFDVEERRESMYSADNYTEMYLLKTGHLNYIRNAPS